MSEQGRAAKVEAPEARGARAPLEQADEVVQAPPTQSHLTPGLLPPGLETNTTSLRSGVGPTMTRQLLRLQASHGNRAVQQLITRSPSARPPTKPDAPRPEPQPQQDEEPLATEVDTDLKGSFAPPSPPPSEPPAGPPAGGSGKPTDGAAAGGGLGGGPRSGSTIGAQDSVYRQTAVQAGGQLDGPESTARNPLRPDDKLGGPLQRTISVGPAEAREEHRSNGSGGGSQGGQPPAGKTEEPTEAAEAAQAGADQGAHGAVAEGGEAPGGGGAEGGTDAKKVDAAGMDEQTAGLVADFLAEFGSRLDEVKGPTAKLADPEVRSAAAQLVPDRKELVSADTVQPPAPQDEAGPLQRSPVLIQRQDKDKKKVPTQTVKVTIPNWPTIPLFRDRNVGSWFLLSGVVESPTYKGEAKPPDNIRDDTTEQELQLTADGKVKGYAATFHKETLAKTGNTELEGKVAVEVTSESVKVSGLSLKLPDLGGSSNVLLEGQFDFDLLDWPVGEPPGVMVLSYTQNIGLKASEFTTDGWTVKGQLFLPLKVSIKPNPAKVAEYAARVIGPRLAAAAPAGLAIAAPLVAGGVCIALWINAIKAGEDMAKAMDSAKLDTLGYVTAYFNTIMGYTNQRYSNTGSAQGQAAAQKVLDGLRWSELPAGAQAKIRAEYINEGTMNLAGVQASMWKQYRAAAIAAYRKEHDWDAWAYDKGLPSDLRALINNLDIVGPPWPVSAY